MFQSPEPLNRDKHARLRLSAAPDYRYAAKEIATPFVSGEMWQIAREFITVFPMKADEPPLAILGTQAGVNAYVGDGNPPWWARYVPAHLRRYPFVAALQPAQAGDTSEQQRFTVFIDAAAPQLNETEGRALFEDDGQPAQLLKEIQTALISLQQDFDLTRLLVKQIDEAGLLVEQSLTIKPLDREPVGIQGFRVIDQQALRTSAPDTLSALARSGALDLIYAHICSLTNARDGLLARKASGAVVERAKTESIDLDALFGAGNDTFKFH